MLPIHHLLSLVPNRVHSAVGRLHRSIWYNHQEITVEATESLPGTISLAEAMGRERSAVRIGSVWGKLYDQRWYRVEFPESDGPVYLNWRDQGEATLYLNGVPFFGFDVAHRHCLLPPGIREGWVESRCVQSGIWHQDATGLDPRGSLFDGAFICSRDADVWRAYHDLKCLCDLLLDQRARENPMIAPHLNTYGFQASVEKVSPFYRRLLRWLDEAVDAYDVHGPKELSKRLELVYEELRGEKTFAHCSLTGHAHIDLVWLWPERVGEFKAVHVFATMNHLMSLYPEFRFAYSQPASYEAVQRRSPELFGTVQDRIRKGQWQATGGMYVESDTMLACGEALGRSFVLGQNGFREITGRFSRLTWLPDVFGYSACLPQLMRLSGVECFFTTKLSWNAVNRFPLSSFVWRGSDGSEVVSHLSQDVGYVTQMGVGEIKAGLNGHQQVDVHPEYLLPTGWGDGGGGTTDEMCERARRLASLPGMPSMGWEHPEEFFERLEKRRDSLPVHHGECYVEAHRGTFTTHGNLKDAFRALERGLQVHEAVVCATGIGAVPVEAWKRMVFAQFHDYIPGSSVHDVYLEGIPELTRLAAEQRAAAHQALETDAGPYSVFNPLPVPVRRWIVSPQEKCEVMVEVPPLSGLSIDDAKVAEAPVPVIVSNDTVSNGMVTLRVDERGTIPELKIEGAEIAITEPLGALVLYPDRPSNFDAWEIDRQSLSLGQRCDSPAKIEPIVEGPHRGGFRVTRAVGKSSAAVVTYRLEAGSPLVHIEVQLDWQEPEALLKMHFPTGYAATNARFGTPFGSILRPQLPTGRLAEAMWEVPFSRYLAVFDESEQDGLFLVTEAKYGANVRFGNIGLSLVRSPKITGCDEIHRHVRPSHLSRVEPATPYTDIGQHVIRCAIGSYSVAAPLDRQPACLADSLFTNPVVYQGQPVQTAYQGLVGGSSLVPAWAVPHTGGAWILRLHETGGRRGHAQVRLAPGWCATAVNLLGEPIGKAVEDRRFAYRPYEIVSLLISRGA